MKKLILLILILSSQALISGWEECSNGLSGVVCKKLSASGSTVFFRSRDSNYVSTDCGNNWQTAGRGGFDYYDQAICGSKILFSDKNGLFQSTDLGANWEKILTDKKKVKKIAASNNSVLIYADNELSYSEDCGNNWTKKINPSNDTLIKSLNIFQNVFLAGFGNGQFYISFDSGLTWKYFYKGTWIANNIDNVVLQDSSILIHMFNKLYYSPDLGKSWFDRDVNNYLGDVKSVNIFGNKLFLICTRGISISTNQGQNWTSTYINDNNNSLYNMIVVNDTILVSSEKGIYASVDSGKTWLKKNKGMWNSPVFDMAVFNNKLFAATNHELFSSADNGDSWNFIRNINDPHSFTVDSNNIYLSTYREILKSSGNGDYWQAIQVTPQNIEYNEQMIKCGDKFFLAVGFKGVFSSTDSCQTWVKKSNGLGNHTCHALAASGHVLYLTTDNEFYKSSDFGESWNEIKTIPLHPHITFLASDDKNIFAGTMSKLFVSADAGVNWKLINYADADYSQSLVYVFGGLLFVSSSSSLTHLGYQTNLLFSTDNGENWSCFNDGLPKYDMVISMAIKDDMVFAGIWAKGVYRAKLSDLLMSDVNQETSGLNNPLTISPNPSNEIIKISPNIPLSEESFLVVFNAYGVEFNRMNLNAKDIGSVIEYSVRNLPAGVYYCSMVSGASRLTRSFVVVR